MKWSTLAVTTAWGMLLPFTQASSHAGGHVATYIKSRADPPSGDMVCGTQRSPSQNADDYYHVTNNTSQQACHQACQDDQKCATFMTWAFSPVESDGLVCYLFTKAATDFKTEKNVEKPFLIYDKKCEAPLQICGFPQVHDDNAPSDYYRVMTNTAPQACHDACNNDQKCASFVTWGASYVKSDGPVCYLYSRHAETFRVRNNERDLFFVHDKECAASR